MGCELMRLQLATVDLSRLVFLQKSVDDLNSITRAKLIEFVDEISPEMENIELDVNLRLGIQ